MTWTFGDSPGTAAPAPYRPAAAGVSRPHPLPAVPPPLRRGNRALGVVFAVVVGVALFLGAVVTALVLLAAGRPDAIVIGLVLAALPVGPLVWCYLWLDRYEPEPKALLAAGFAWGALVATGAALVLESLGQVLNGADSVTSAVVVAPLTEEAGKALFVLLLLWLRRNSIDGLVDGLVYAGLVGVGFAFTENILYYAGAYTGGPGFGTGGLDAATGLFVVRGIFSPFAHPLFTSMTGIGVAIAVTTRNRTVRVVAPLAGYAVAVALHAGWNASSFWYGGQLFMMTYLVAMVPGFLVVLGLAIWFRVREGRMLAGAMEDLARRGYLPAGDLPFLVRPAGRRTARQRAAHNGGPLAEGLVLDYQQQAVELAMLHNRMLRGTARADAAERGEYMVRRLAALRAHLTAVAAPPPSQAVWAQHGSWR